MSVVHTESPDKEKGRDPTFISSCWPVDFLATDILGRMQRIHGINRESVVGLEWNLRLTKALRKEKTVTTRIVTIFIQHRVTNSGKPSTVLTDIGPKYTSSFFNALRKTGVKTITTTE